MSITQGSKVTKLWGYVVFGSGTNTEGIGITLTVDAHPQVPKTSKMQHFATIVNMY